MEIYDKIKKLLELQEEVVDHFKVEFGVSDETSKYWLIISKKSDELLLFDNKQQMLESVYKADDKIDIECDECLDVSQIKRKEDLTLVEVNTYSEPKHWILDSSKEITDQNLDDYKQHLNIFKDIYNTSHSSFFEYDEIMSRFNVGGHTINFLKKEGYIESFSNNCGKITPLGLSLMRNIDLDLTIQEKKIIERINKEPYSKFDSKDCVEIIKKLVNKNII